MFLCSKIKKVFDKFYLQKYNTRKFLRRTIHAELTLHNELYVHVLRTYLFVIVKSEGGTVTAGRSDMSVHRIRKCRFCRVRYIFLTTTWEEMHRHIKCPVHFWLERRLL